MGIADQIAMMMQEPDERRKQIQPYGFEYHPVYLDSMATYLAGLQDKMQNAMTAPGAELPITFDAAPLGIMAGQKARGFSKALAENRVFEGLYDKLKRFEIDDSAAKVNREGKSILKSLFDHPELYEAYPEIGQISTRLAIEPGTGVSAGGYNPRKPPGNMSESITVVSPNAEQAKKDLLHEIQHAVQEREGFAKGWSPRQLLNYLRSAGEIESRDVANRANLTAAQRAEIPPYTTENIPVEEAIVQGQQKPGIFEYLMSFLKGGQ